MAGIGLIMNGCTISLSIFKDLLMYLDDCIVLKSIIVHLPVGMSMCNYSALKLFLLTLCSL